MNKFFSPVKVLCLLGAGLTFLGITRPISAQTPPPFNGTISFDGVATLDGPIGSATKFTGIFGISGPASHAQVTFEPTGNYAAVPLAVPATFNPFTFGSAPSSAIMDFSLWSFSVGTTSYSFVATSETYLSQMCGFLNISGNGTAYVDGFAYTNATWKITATGDGPNLTYGESTSVVSPSQSSPIPEPSSLMLLTGLAPLLGLFNYRRRSISRINLGRDLP
jgi:hypothetical protein